ncbi:MAG: MoaD/ThiS family protein [Candidatus Omnitrophica bacterium]|nr:MoaD/ThiS family protein [Candidatus Omnitrophota bacterium]MCA9425581.1 MoaD/ThiS family protein [Candidatus Omnitrophota bacterium]MCB9769934.1 MoaD/ThiS family protein [Candidatus Omnitrophota bacterium]MCB9784656.1 MoaD/ThiS family protein [Candidatus Omnitrophota bacterium]
MIRVTIPAHLRTLARVEGELEFELDPPVTQDVLLTAIEDRYPMLKGTIRDHVTKKRRPFIRFFACEEDLSHESLDAPLPQKVVNGEEPYMVVGGIAGG